jgi:hypothetical protein
MNELIVLSVNDGEITYVDTIGVPEKQKRIRGLREWIKDSGRGQDGTTYRLAKFVTPPVRAEETKLMLPVELPLSEPKTKADKKAKPEAVEA